MFHFSPWIHRPDLRRRFPSGAVLESRNRRASPPPRIQVRKFNPSSLLTANVAARDGSALLRRGPRRAATSFCFSILVIPIYNSLEECGVPRATTVPTKYPFLFLIFQAFPFSFETAARALTPASAPQCRNAFPPLCPPFQRARIAVFCQRPDPSWGRTFARDYRFPMHQQRFRDVCVLSSPSASRSLQIHSLVTFSRHQGMSGLLVLLGSRLFGFPSDLFFR